MNHIYNEPQFGENWFTYPSLYTRMVDRFSDGSIFVEVGSWKGKSSSYMAVEIANSNKKIEFYCVDTWKGSVEHQPGGIFYTQDLDKLFDVFTENMKPVKDYYKPIRMSSIEASKTFEDGSLDFVFIDASHEYEDVKNDINAWLPKVKKGGVLSGHDYGYVRRAVDESIKANPIEGDCWFYEVG